MTREESIDRLRKISEKTPIRTNGDDLVAITMAIKALSQEPCDDAISREWLMRKATERFYTTNYFNHISAMIEEAPSVTQKSGKWIDYQDGRWIYAKCSECGTVHDTRSNYCPSCGAKMESEDKE